MNVTNIEVLTTKRNGTFMCTLNEDTKTARIEHWIPPQDKGKKSWVNRKKKICEIPSVFTIENDKYLITEIGDYAFTSMGIEKVIFNHHIQRIENGAFKRNPLTELNLPNTCVYIGENAFNGCDIQRITFERKTKKEPFVICTVEAHAFRMCYLKHKQLPQNMRANEAACSYMRTLPKKEVQV